MPPDGAGDTPAPCAESMVAVHKHLEAKSSESEIRSVTYVCVMNGIVATALLGQGPRTREDRSPGEGDGSSPPPLGGGGRPPSKQPGRGQGCEGPGQPNPEGQSHLWLLFETLHFEPHDSLFPNINYRF